MSDGSEPEQGRDWRDPDRAFRQAEAYGGDARPGGGDARPAPASQVMAAYVAGAAMLATTAVLLLFGAPSWASFLIGLAVFVGVASWRLRVAAAQAATRRVDSQIGVDAAAVRAALEEADDRLGRIAAAAADAADRGVADALLAMTRAARKVVDTVEADPRDFDRARKFFRVYLPSCEAAVDKYFALGVRDREIDARFRALVDDMTAAAERQSEALTADDKLDLEVELEVLSERLRAETGER